MPARLLVGPLLGVESNEQYTVCFLSDSNVPTATVTIGDEISQATHIADTCTGKFWRASFSLPPSPEAQQATYNIQLNGQSAHCIHGRNSWTFYVPATDEKPKFAYASCNGFSSSELMSKTEDHYKLWRRLAAQHQLEPFSLLIMGGDQLYADSMWQEVTPLYNWTRLSRSKKIDRSMTKMMKEQVDRFYDRLYQSRWRDENMSLALASIPSVMMWDDHDIFDGWGSYPEELHTCDVYKGIFEIAKKYFELFQIRSRQNTSLLDNQAGHYAFAFEFRGHHILGLDNRSERTLQQVMSKSQWSSIIGYLGQKANAGDVFVMSAVPVIYRDFSLTEAVFDMTPWEEELTDDLKDHWRAKEHQGERARLIMRLLENASNRQHDGQTGRTVILSGDVHLGCIGVVNDRSNTQPRKIHQIVSSGIVHPAPSRLQWLGIMAATNDRDEYLNEDKTIQISMLQPYGADKYLRARNYVTIKEGTDRKLWINWETESSDNPAYPLA